MTTASHPSDPAAGVPWPALGLRYYALGAYLRGQFGCRVHKVSVDAGFGCPNVDGTVARGGCLFCNIASFSPSRRMASGSISQQLDEGVRRLRRRYRAQRFLAYFQPATNTHAPIARLGEAFDEAVAHPDVVGLVIGTRPDAVGEPVLDLLAEFSQRVWLSVEFGLQTIHERSLEWLGRGHRYDAFLDAVTRCRRRGLRVGAHVILGLPGESRDDVVATARELTRLGIDSVKLHNLHVVKDTPLAELFAAGKLTLATQEEYVALAVDFLEHLHPGCVIDRLCGDAPPDYLVAPAWCADKAAVRTAIHAEFRRRDTRQGVMVPQPLTSHPATA